MKERFTKENVKNYMMDDLKYWRTLARESLEKMRGLLYNSDEYNECLRDYNAYTARGFQIIGMLAGLGLIKYEVADEMYLKW